MTDTNTYDFIIVGAGPSGASLSSRLASHLPSHTILLLEAGSSSSAAPSYLFDRYSALKTPGLNYGYQTTLQIALHNRVVDYSRGKGLGGTSLINFALWNRGSRDDWDQFARRVGSREFEWENVGRVFDGIEGFKDPAYADDGIKQYVRIEREIPGEKGLVSVEYARHVDDYLLGLMKGVVEHGFGINRDLNSGDPIGVGFAPATSKDGVRVTARTYLQDVPANLTISSGVQVARLLFDGKKAVGVLGIDGQKLFATKEVILSAGALDTPKLLLLSGIGPASELEALDLPVVQDLPGVGKGLQDHCHFPMSAVLKEHVRPPNPIRPGSDALAAARSQFAENGTGPLSYVNGSYVMGFLKDAELYESEEFKALDSRTREHLLKSTVPSWEFSTGLPLLGPPPPGPARQYLVSLGVLMNPQSRGSVTLQSSDPTQPALFDPRLMTHSYDRKVLTTAARRILEFMKTPSIAETIERPANMPASDSEEDVLAFVQLNLKSTWHMSGTAKMGDVGDEMAVVNTEFVVRGVEGLRVVDLSVLPFLLNMHPVAAAYVMGEVAAKAIGRLCGA